MIDTLRFIFLILSKFICQKWHSVVFFFDKQKKKTTDHFYPKILKQSDTFEINISNSERDNFLKGNVFCNKRKEEEKKTKSTILFIVYLFKNFFLLKYYIKY